MLAVARSFAVAYMPYQVGRLPRWARTAIERTCTPAFARYLLAQPAQLTAAAGDAPEDRRDLPGRERRAGRGSGHGGGRLRLRAGQRRHRRVPAEAGQRARALAGRSPGGVSGGAQAVPARAGADDPAAAAGGDAGVPRRGRRIGGAMRGHVRRRQRARRRRSAGGRPDLPGRGRAVRARRPRPVDPGGDQLRRVDVRPVKRRGRALGRELRRRDGPDAVPAGHLGHVQGAGARRRGAAERLRRGRRGVQRRELPEGLRRARRLAGRDLRLQPLERVRAAGPLAGRRLLHAGAHRAGSRHLDTNARARARRSRAARSASRRRAATRPGRSRSRPGSRRSSPRPTSPTKPARGATTCSSATTATPSCPPGSPGRR